MQEGQGMGQSYHQLKYLSSSWIGARTRKIR